LQPISLPSDRELLHDLLVEAQFYKLTELEQMVALKLNSLNSADAAAEDVWDTLYFQTGYHPQAEQNAQFPDYARQQLHEKQCQGFKIVQIQPGMHFHTRVNPNYGGPVGVDSSNPQILMNAYWTVTLRKQSSPANTLH